jgi:hypothetical protein
MTVMASMVSASTVMNVCPARFNSYVTRMTHHRRERRREGEE